MGYKWNHPHSIFVDMFHGDVHSGLVVLQEQGVYKVLRGNGGALLRARGLQSVAREWRGLFESEGFTKCHEEMEGLVREQGV